MDLLYLQECIDFEIKIGDKTYNFVWSLAKQKMNLRISENRLGTHGKQKSIPHCSIR